ESYGLCAGWSLPTDQSSPDPHLYTDVELESAAGSEAGDTRFGSLSRNRSDASSGCDTPEPPYFYFWSRRCQGQLLPEWKRCLLHGCSRYCLFHDGQHAKPAAVELVKTSVQR